MGAVSRKLGVTEQIYCWQRREYFKAQPLPSYAESHGLSGLWMNAERVPFEALKERSRVCFGGFRLPARSRFGEGRPYEACGGTKGFSPWGSTSRNRWWPKLLHPKAPLSGILEHLNPWGCLEPIIQRSRHPWPLPFQKRSLRMRHDRQMSSVLCTEACDPEG